MNVRDLACWPPRWRRLSDPAGEEVRGERGVLIATRWDHRTRSLALTMEDGGARYTAVLADPVQGLSALCLLLDWHIGRPLATIGGLEIAL
jgi:hypothetical protein